MRYLALLFLITFFSAPAGAAVNICGEPVIYKAHLPQLFREDSMPSALEEIEKLKRKTADFPFDGRITEIHQESVTVRLVGSDQVKRSVHIPSHIKVEDLAKGMAVRLGTHGGKPILLATFPQLALDTHYAGKGTIIPSPPKISVEARPGGWLIRWPAVTGANRYRVYRNDTPDETSPDEVGYTGGLQMTVPYNGTFPYPLPSFRYFAVRSVSGLNESQLSGWITDNIAPPVPSTFDAEDDIQGHRLLIQGTDASLTDPNFHCWEIEQADDGTGLNAVSLGYAGLSDFPKLVVVAEGVVKFYRVRALDHGGTASAWTAWQVAVRIITGGDTVQEKFDTYGGPVPVTQDPTWQKILDMDTDEPWVMELAGPEFALSRPGVFEGDGGLRVTKTGGTGAAFYLRYTGDFIPNFVNWNLWQDGAFFILPVVLGQTTHQVSINLEWLQSSSGIVTFSLPQNSPAGTYYLMGAISATVTEQSIFQPAMEVAFRVNSAGTASGSITFDGLHLVRRTGVTSGIEQTLDPTEYDYFGGKWLQAIDAGTNNARWRIYDGNRPGEPPKPFTGAQDVQAGTPSRWYLLHKPGVNIVRGMVQAGVWVKAEGSAGLAFFVKDTTPNSWDMYAVEADSALNQVRLVKWVAGVRTVIAAQGLGFDFATNKLLWLGVDFREYSSDPGRIKIYASLQEGNLIRASNLKISLKNASLTAGGGVGMLTFHTRSRFVNFVAGSPAHSEVADVAYGLDGPILSGDSRVHFNLPHQQFEITPDGLSFLPLGLKLRGYAKNSGATTVSTLTTWTQVAGLSLDAYIGTGTAYILAIVTGYHQASANPNWFLGVEVDGGSVVAVGQYFSNVNQQTIATVSGLHQVTGLSEGVHNFKVKVFINAAGNLVVGDAGQRPAFMLVVEG